MWWWDSEDERNPEKVGVKNKGKKEIQWTLVTFFTHSHGHFTKDL